MYAAKRVGPQGLAVGVDQHSLKVSLPSNGRYLQRDALTIEPETLAEIHPSPFDVVLSDMAPHTSGHRFLDQKRSLRLFLRALALATLLSRKGSSFLGKLFQSEDLTLARQQAESWYGQVRVVRPQATRKQSYEVYLLCQRRRATGPCLLAQGEQDEGPGERVDSDLEPTDRPHLPVDSENERGDGFGDSDSDE
jgi:23S rRNA (uridine2552-2'-O)-methyltransferase